MKTKEQILEKIKSLESNLDSIHEEREELKNKYGGIDPEQNEDMLTDIATTSDQIKMLEWVISN
jgi:chromosome segregation ATPase